MNVVKIGIIGASGQVGSALLRAFGADSAFASVGICRNSLSAARLKALGTTVRLADTYDANDLSKNCADLDVLINCALPQYGPSRTSVANHRLARALTAASSGRRLIHLSSVAVYGDFLSGQQNLFHRPRPDTSYGFQKLQMERLLTRLGEKHRVECTILRLGHVYGPELRWSETMLELIQSPTFRLPFDGQLPSNAICIDNVITGIREAVLVPPREQLMNLTDSPQRTWRVIFDMHSAALGAAPVHPLGPHESDRIYQQRRSLAHTRLSRRVIGETLHWLARLPASYVAAVPSLKAVAQRIVSCIASETLDARLWALHCRIVDPSANIAPLEPGMLSLLVSEPVPGPHLAYTAREHSHGVVAFSRWCEIVTRHDGDYEMCPSMW